MHMYMSANKYPIDNIYSVCTLVDTSVYMTVYLTDPAYAGEIRRLFCPIFHFIRERQLCPSLLLRKQCPVQDEPEGLKAEHTTACLRPVAE